MAALSESHTCFVWIFCHPGNCNPSDLRVTKAQKESAVGFGHQHVLSLLLVHKAQNGSRREQAGVNDCDVTSFQRQKSHK